MSTPSNSQPTTSTSVSPNSASIDSTSSPTPTISTPTTSSPAKAQAALNSVTSILPNPPTITPSSPHAILLLTSPEISNQICTLLHQPSSGSGDNHLCRWLYDTFHSSDPSLQLAVLRFIPLIAGLYLTRITQRQRQPLAGFEAILLALYAHETTVRDNQPVTVTVPNLAHPSIYHESLTPQNKNSTDLSIAVISASLEPHGTVRSSRRARIVGVALELFFSKIWVMPLGSKIDFCDFLAQWAGHPPQNDDDNDNNNTRKHKSEGGEEFEGRILLPWELLGPCLRILGHCLLGVDKGKEEVLHEKARKACKCLYARVMHDVNPKAILAVGSLLRLFKMERDLEEVDYTEIRSTRVISI